MIASTPKPPYYAVIFTSIRTAGDNGYEKMAEAMLELARRQPGYLGVESARDSLGITVSYWESLDAIAAWKQNAEHIVAQNLGRKIWYEKFQTRICKVERDYGFTRAQHWMLKVKQNLWLTGRAARPVGSVSFA
jgi:heme-degrading monooxygenase HmoA